jgi:replicative DNA helicase
MTEELRLLPSHTTIVNLRDVFRQAIQVLAKPYPAIQLPEWPAWNKLVGGFRMREYSILCGPTGTGKTTLLANLSKQLALQKVSNFVMSIETGSVDYCIRFISALEGVDLNTGDAVAADELAKISARHLELITNGKLEFSIYESRIDVEQLKADIRYAVEILGCRVIFVDNLNYLLRIGKAADQNIEMDRVTHDLIEFVKTVEAHIVMVMHPRKTEDKRVLSEFDVKGSSTSVQEAQNVFLFNRPLVGDVVNGKRHHTDRDFFIAKMRRRGRYVGKTLHFKVCGGCKYIEDGYR